MNADWLDSIIQRTSHSQSGFLHDVRVNLRCRHVLVAEQILHVRMSVAVFQQMRRERMSQRVARRALGNPGFATAVFIARCKLSSCK